MQRWVAQMGYKDLVTFTSTDQAGGTVYHTNVMMAIGTGGCAAGQLTSPLARCMAFRCSRDDDRWRG